MTKKLSKKTSSTKKTKSRIASGLAGRQAQETSSVTGAVEDASVTAVPAKTSEGTPTRADTVFPIVGIGASAGGLEACSELLEHLPADTGMAFVLVQHLDPSHKSMLAELLGRTTAMPIDEVVDGTRVEPNHAYIIPPNTELGILNKTLHLLPRTEKSGPPLPIDYFMQSLAQDQGGAAIGIVLSGSASDGTIGLKAIKAAGGITFAQDEASAKYSSMPRSAVAAGCVDFVLSPREIAKELVRIMRQPRVLRLIAAKDTELPEEGAEDLNKIFMLLRNRTGHDFTYYKHPTIRRRIQRRMVLHKLDRAKDYLRYLREHPAELDELFEDILINVTGFFRDPETFDAFREKVFPALVNGRGEDETLRIWVAGCSTGEEPYSIAMSLLEFLGDRAARTPIQIFASDIDPKAIEKARAGIYPEGIKADVSPARLQRFFIKVPTGYQVSKNVRDLVLFAVQNVAKDPPFSRVHLVCCPNLMIYLSNVLQKKVLQIFHYALKPNGYLILGNSESISGSADLFSMLDRKHKIYTKKSIASLRRYEFGAMPAGTPYFAPTEPDKPPAPQVGDAIQQAERIILNEYGPPGVITNRDMEILHFRGRTGPYMEPASGSASLNLMKMARADLLMDLRTALRQAIKDGERVRRENVRLSADHEEKRVHLQVIPLEGHHRDDSSYLVLFEPANVTPPQMALTNESVATKIEDSRDQRIRELEQELQATREYLQTIIEDQETTNEELQSANEEIQSTNEELQSTNEELETAKEELQSTNEELVTVNEELESRNSDLSHLNNDLSNLLNSVQLPIIMLNQDLTIRHFTPGTTKLFNLVPSDVGRRLGDIKANIDIPDLDARLLRVIDTVTPENVEVRDKAGNWYNLRLRPYKTMDHRIAGAVMVFVSLSSPLERRLAAVLRDSNDAITLRDIDGRILAWNLRAERLYGYSLAEALALNVNALIPASVQAKEDLMIAALRRGEPVAPLATERLTKDGKRIDVLITSTLLLDDHGGHQAIATTERPIDAQP